MSLVIDMRSYSSPDVVNINMLATLSDRLFIVGELAITYKINKKLKI